MKTHPIINVTCQYNSLSTRYMSSTHPINTLCHTHPIINALCTHILSTHTLSTHPINTCPTNPHFTSPPPLYALVVEPDLDYVDQHTSYQHTLSTLTSPPPLPPPLYALVVEPDLDYLDRIFVPWEEDEKNEINENQPEGNTNQGEQRGNNQPGGNTNPGGQGQGGNTNPGGQGVNINPWGQGQGGNINPWGPGRLGMYANDLAYYEDVTEELYQVHLTRAHTNI